mgnify:CR=1 FL=1
MKNILRREQIAQLTSKISYYEQCARYEQDVTEELSLYANRFNRIQEELLKRSLTVRIIKIIERNLPDTMWLNTIIVSSENILTLSGYSTDTLSDITYLKSVLENDGSFDNVTIQEANITQETTAQQKNKKTFTITAVIKPVLAQGPAKANEE